MRIADRSTSRTATEVGAVPVLVQTRARITITFDFVVRFEPSALVAARARLLTHADTFVELRTVGAEAAFATAERVGCDGGSAGRLIDWSASLVHSTVRAVES